VPNTSNFTPAQIALGAAIDDIKAAHSCDEHGVCFINAELQHREMNRFRLNLWGEALSGKCTAGDPPPKQLLDAWTGGSTSKPKARGRTGPFPAVQPVATSSNDTANLLLATIAPVMSMMAQNMGGYPRPPSSYVPVAPRSPERASSPPPAVEDELDTFMEAFRVAKKITGPIIAGALAKLRAGQYSPDVLCEPSVTTERLTELTGLAEGQVHALKKFAREWSGKIEGKRARRGIS
ncbi:hypothetical protein DFH06DRAFT_1005013, partial [Mycena polygramma]